MVQIFWVISLLFTIIGSSYYALSVPENAIQQLVIATTSLAIVIIPYCLARALTEISNVERKDKEKDDLERSLELISQGISDLNQKASLELLHSYATTKIHEQLSDQDVDEIVGDLKKLLEKEFITVVDLENAKIKLRKRTQRDF